jgi:acetylglutamate kinase
VTRAGSRRGAVVVLKLGGELLEQPEDVARMAAGIVALASEVKLVVVHGGGREIDAALAVAGIAKKQVDGVRVTDQATLDVVVAVLAGTLNTRLVSAVRRAGGRPVGLTGVDASVAVVRRAAPMQTVAGDVVDLGLVGVPVAQTRPELLSGLSKSGYVPIVACIGATTKGDVLNVNADTLASHLAAVLGAKRLIIAGGTAGVLDQTGQSIARLTSREAGQLIRSGVANRGMVAKLEACRTALRRGVGDVIITNGRLAPFRALAALTYSGAASTQVVR